jgi:hypothetical protein
VSKKLQVDNHLVTAAQLVMVGSNTHRIQHALGWYRHWIRIGNKAASEAAALTLHLEIREALAIKDKVAQTSIMEWGRR